MSRTRGLRLWPDYSDLLPTGERSGEPVRLCLLSRLETGTTRPAASCGVRVARRISRDSVPPGRVELPAYGLGTRRVSRVVSPSCDEKTGLVGGAWEVRVQALAALRAIAATGALAEDAARQLASAARTWALAALDEPAAVRDAAGVVRLAAQLEAAEPRLLASLGAQLAEALLAVDVDAAAAPEAARS